MANDDYTLDPEDFSIVRQSDTDYYEFGKPSNYQEGQMLLSQQAAKAEDDAMAYLRAAMNKQPEITPTQGFAAALLGVVPTLGGYLIGKSVGDPDLPEGIHGFDATKYKTGAYAGGLAGYELGDKTSKRYISGLEAAQDRQNEMYEEMAKVQAAEFGRTQGAQLALTNDQLQLQQQAVNQQEYLEKQKEAQLQMERDLKREQLGKYYEGDFQDRRPTLYDFMTPEQRQAYIAKQAGVDATGQRVVKDPRPFSVPAEQQNKLVGTYDFVQGSLDIADQLDKFESWGQYKATMAATGLDPNAIFSQLENNKDKLVRARTGAALNNQESVIYNRMLLGDFTAGPKAVANILRKLAIAESIASKRRVDLMGQMMDPEGLNSAFDAVITRAENPLNVPPIAGGVNKSDPKYLDILNRKRKEKGL